MEAQQDTVIFEDVSSVEIQTRNGPSKKYNLTTTSGKRFETWDKETAVEAAKLKGQNVKVSYRVETRSKDGRVFTNNKVLGLEPTNEHAEDTTVTVQAGPGTFANPVNPVNQYAARDARIARQVAFKAAIELIAVSVEAGSDPNIDAIDALTNALVPVVEGTYEAQNVAGGTKEPFPFDKDAGEAIPTQTGDFDIDL